MFCPNPKCTCTSTQVLTVRQKNNGKTRRRVCPMCNLRFSTEEILLIPHGKKLINPYDLKNTSTALSRGSKHPMAVLTEENVLSMRKEAKEGKTRRELQIKYGMSKSQIDRIIRHQSWAHV